MKRISENIWENDDGRLFHTKLQCFINRDNLPPTMKYKKSVGLYELHEGNDFSNMNEGHRFVMIDFCENVTKHKKTLNVSFTRFQTIDMTWRKYDCIKENNGFVHFEWGFMPKRAYLLFCERNEEFPDYIRILKSKEIIKEYGS